MSRAKSGLDPFFYGSFAAPPNILTLEFGDDDPARAVIVDELSNFDHLIFETWLWHWNPSSLG
jgi:hypothetical protein